MSWSDAPDGRRTVIGWMSNWQYAAEVPTMQFRSANTLPREIALFTAPDGRIYASSAPSPELLSLRGNLVTKARGVKLGSKARHYALPTANDGVCEIVLNLTARDGAKVNFTLANAAGEKVDMVYDVDARTMSFDRRNSGITDFSQDFPAVTVTPTFSDSDRLELRIFVDRSSIELFGDNGRFVMTNLVFPTTPYSTLAVSAEGNARIADLQIYSLNIK
ncbi:MAG: glycoside hydrolase family 32 protein [Muribaculaceae bacterium]|nr:glycoside hydrolase family 32 protein [Muribaculaceae bacterium]